MKRVITAFSEFGALACLNVCLPLGEIGSGFRVPGKGSTLCSHPVAGRGSRPVAQVGTALRDARLRRGISIEQAAQDTRIALRFLQALEAEAWDRIPAPVYVRGFLRSYAAYLRLDPQELLEDLLQDAPQVRPMPPVAAAAARRAAVAERSEAGTPWAAIETRDDEEQVAVLPEPPVRRPRRPARRPDPEPDTEEGVLLERGGPRRQFEFPRRVAAIVAAACGVLALIAIGVAMDSSEPGGLAPPVATTPATRQPGGGTVITVGTPTPPGRQAESPTPGAPGDETPPTAGEDEGARAGEQAARATTPSPTPAPPPPTPAPPTPAPPTPAPPTPAPPSPTPEPPAPTPTPTPGEVAPPPEPDPESVEEVATSAVWLD
jgi:hypothetical protein